MRYFILVILLTVCFTPIQTVYAGVSVNSVKVKVKPTTKKEKKKEKKSSKVPMKGLLSIIFGVLGVALLSIVGYIGSAFVLTPPFVIGGIFLSVTLAVLAFRFGLKSIKESGSWGDNKTKGEMRLSGRGLGLVGVILGLTVVGFLFFAGLAVGLLSLAY